MFCDVTRGTHICCLLPKCCKIVMHGHTKHAYIFFEAVLITFTSTSYATLHIVITSSVLIDVTKPVSLHKKLFGCNLYCETHS